MEEQKKREGISIFWLYADLCQLLTRSVFRANGRPSEEEGRELFVSLAKEGGNTSWTYRTMLERPIAAVFVAVDGAKIASHKGNHTIAEAGFRLAIALLPTECIYHEKLGALYLDLAREQHALVAAELPVPNPTPVEWRARALVSSGHALACLSGSDPTASLLYAELLEASGCKNEALVHCEHALHLEAPACLASSPAATLFAALGGVARNDGAEVLAVGTAVQCRFKETPDFYSGTISEGPPLDATASDGGTYTVTYSDGDRERDVARDKIRLPDQRQRRFLRDGDAVSARCLGQGGAVRTGVVKGVHMTTHDPAAYGKAEAREYTVIFDDRTLMPERMSRSFIFGRFSTPTAAPPPPPPPPLTPPPKSPNGGGVAPPPPPPPPSGGLPAPDAAGAALEARLAAARDADHAFIPLRVAIAKEEGTPARVKAAHKVQRANPMAPPPEHDWSDF